MTNDNWTPQKIRELREALKHTQLSFAVLLGVDCGTISRWERGIRMPHKSMIDKLEGLAVDRN